MLKKTRIIVVETGRPFPSHSGSYVGNFRKKWFLVRAGYDGNEIFVRTNGESALKEDRILTCGLTVECLAICSLKVKEMPLFIAPAICSLRVKETPSFQITRQETNTRTRP